MVFCGMGVRLICRCLGGWTLEDWRLERGSRVLVRLFALCEERHLQVPCAIEAPS
jgi:hypothetical protein